MVDVSVDLLADWMAKKMAGRLAESSVVELVHWIVDRLADVTALM